MATPLSIQPVALTDVGAITPLASRAPTTTAKVSNIPLPASTSSVVRISEQGRFLAATATTTIDTPQIATATSQTTAVVTATPQTSGLNADAVVAGQTASAASITLQNLLNDPTLRAIANSQFNPLYSALLAAARQQDFTTPQALNQADAIPVDIPAPVLRIAPVEGIGNFDQAAREFA